MRRIGEERRAQVKDKSFDVVLDRSRTLVKAGFVINHPRNTLHRMEHRGIFFYRVITRSIFCGFSRWRCKMGTADVRSIQYSGVIHPYSEHK